MEKAVPAVRDYAKIEVNGENEEPLYAFLKAEMPEEKVEGFKNKLAMSAISKISKTAKNKGDIKWNFTKFLVDKEGNVIKRYAPTVSPEKIDSDIAAIL